MDALRFWSDWMADREPPSDEAAAAYRAAREHTRHGRLAEAEPLLVNQLEALERADAPEAAPANHALAVALCRSGDLDGAIFHCVRGIYLYHRREDPLGVWAGLLNLSLLHQARGEARQAMQVRAKAAEVRRALEDSGRPPRTEAPRDGRGEPLPLLSVAAGRPARRKSG